ncbi:ATP-binding protein [Dyella humi]|uniref:histidine kinase n=1 Tax=Dyella humi TaxID=1770547 RepID=A0ABW8IDI0_9GAMM
MKRHHFLDSIAWWFSLNIIAAILVALLLNLAFVQLAGVWAEPPLESAGLIENLTGIARAMNALPMSNRGLLATKLSSSDFIVKWYPSRVDVPIPDVPGKNPYDERWARLRELADLPGAGVLIQDTQVRPWSSMTVKSVHPRYSLAMELIDHSWVSFSTDRRNWGMSQSAKWLIATLFLMLSCSLTASAASRRLARPIQHFSSAAEAFGSSSKIEPLRLSGPFEIREAAEAFNAMQSRIQELVSSRTEMFTAISHDLRAPLTRIRLRGEFIEDVEQQRRLFRDVDEMEAMIEASLNYFRFDGQQEDATRFELGELIQSVLDDFQDMGRTVAMAGMHQLVYRGQPLAIRRALTNLVDNAVKYGISALVTLTVQGRSVVITIDDNGPGVTPDLIPKLFRPFFRGEPSRNRETGGFGLGLASAYSIIRSHGGELVLSNRQPHGLRATIWLPREWG